MKSKETEQSKNAAQMKDAADPAKQTAPEGGKETADAPDKTPVDLDPEAAALRERVKTLEEEKKAQDDRYLRMAAEYDNFRRRSREEREGVYAGAVSDVLTELLPIIDNLERASLYDDGDKVKEGLALTVKAADAVLGKLGVEAFGKPGETFDPNLHNAVLHIEDEAFGEGEIVEVLQKGYKKGGKIIRFAMVKTAN